MSNKQVLEISWWKEKLSRLLVKTFPFSENKINGIYFRKFSRFTKTSELVWHRDLEDRYVTVLNENDWYLQLDNELPFKLEFFKTYFIPKGVYHRVIKGKTSLRIGIKKISC